MSVTRHQIREMAFQILFALNSNPDTDVQTIVDSLLSENHISQEPTYFKSLIEGVVTHQSVLDELISSKLTSKWNFSRLNKTDLIILRLSLYEIKFENDIPNKVALNEALQLAKEFSGEKDRIFINGILSNFI